MVALIRNFCIIAHVDHGKSTLADRLLERTGCVSPREMQAQCLDSLAVERERGITVKLAAARLQHTPTGATKPYSLNLIDTPGHVDFSYEVSRSLAACEGCLLVVDASQGVQAQTLAHLRLARAAGLAVVPLLNKVDLPGADPEAVARELCDLVPEVEMADVLRISAKLGTGIDTVLDAVTTRIPPPAGSPDAPLRALIFDSYYDPYKGVVAQIRVVDGTLRTGDVVRFMNSRCEHQVAELGVRTPAPTQVPELRAGDVGYLAASIKAVGDTRVGDTVTLAARPADNQLPGYEEAKPMVFCGLFATASDQHEALRDALGKLQLSDAALSFQPEVSPAMGHGFRCGFLGLLHMEIVQERLEREHGLDLITTAPTVVFKAVTTDGQEVTVDRPDKLPPPASRRAILEPYARVQVITPAEHVGPLMELLQSRRGEYLDMQYLAEGRTALLYDLPLAEVVGGLFDAVKSRSRGYASLDYTLTGWREGDLVLLEMAINGELAPPLACIVHRSAATSTGRALAKRLKDLIPRQQFRVPLQAMLGTRVIAAEAIPAARKDVLAKCYGGDISRKKKLLKKQARGKKRMKMFGKVEVPQEAFMAVLQINRDGD